MKYATFRYDTAEVENGLNIRSIILLMAGKTDIGLSSFQGYYVGHFYTEELL